MTWVGWFLVVELGVSSLLAFYKAGQGGSVKTPRETLITGVEMLVLMVLVLMFGTGSL